MSWADEIAILLEQAWGYERFLKEVNAGACSSQADFGEEPEPRSRRPTGALVLQQ